MPAGTTVRDGAWREAGRLLALAVRDARSAAPRGVPAAHAIAGFGLDGDRHADALSPRALLLAGAPAYRRHRLAPATLRENLLLEIDTATLASGTLLQVGADVLLWLTFQCEPCARLDACRPGLARAIGAGRGMLARVLKGGTVRVGDPVRQLEGVLPRWSDDWRERVASILARVPQPMVVEYGQLARLAGLQPSFCRALPARARKLGLADRAVAQHARPDLPRWQGERLFDVAGVEAALAGMAALPES